MGRFRKEKTPGKKEYGYDFKKSKGVPEGVNRKISFLMAKTNELEGRMESVPGVQKPPSGIAEDFERFHEMIRLIRANGMRMDELERSMRHSANNDDIEKLLRKMETAMKEIIYLRESMFKQEKKLNDLWRMRKVLNDQQRRFGEIGNVLGEILDIRIKGRGKEEPPEAPPVKDEEIFENLIDKLDEGKRKLKNIVEDMSSNSPVIIE